MAAIGGIVIEANLNEEEPRASAASCITSSESMAALRMAAGHARVWKSDVKAAIQQKHQPIMSGEIKGVN